MKKWLLLIIIALVLFSICSCSDVYAETYISDVSAYDTIWDLPESRAFEKSELFPMSISELQVIHFSCYHQTYQLVGTGWQVELIIKYDSDSFSAEHERLKNLCEESVVCGDNEYFDYPAYATVWNWTQCFEYAVVNEQNSTISYIYLQLINKEDIAITSDNIPRNYEMDMPEAGMYSLYEGVKYECVNP